MCHIEPARLQRDGLINLAGMLLLGLQTKLEPVHACHLKTCHDAERATLLMYIRAVTSRREPPWERK